MPDLGTSSPISLIPRGTVARGTVARGTVARGAVARRRGRGWRARIGLRTRPGATWIARRIRRRREAGHRVAVSSHALPVQDIILLLYRHLRVAGAAGAHHRAQPGARCGTDRRAAATADRRAEPRSEGSGEDRAANR